MNGWRPAIEAMRRLSVRELVRLGVVKIGHDGSGTWQWSDAETRKVLASVSYRTEWQGRTGTLHLSYTANEQPKNYPIPIEVMSLHLGGYRYWLRCPVTGRRCAMLYLVKGTFVARTAIRPLPTYALQRASKHDRVMGARWAIRRKLGDPGCLLDPLWKPKRMRWATFEKYQRRDDELNALEEHHLLRLIARLGRFGELI